MADTPHYRRLVRPFLEEALADTPVVLVHGPRQCGKTTLAREVGDAAGYAYRTFDDDTLRAAAEADPVGFVADLPERTVLDEVQRVPGLFTSLKAAVDRDRTPGRFLLTGSANVLLVPHLSDSLAGRMEVLRLHPLSQHELAGLAGETPTFVERLFQAQIGLATDPREGSRLGHALAEMVVAGGYPAALERTTPRRRAAWYRAYVDTIVQRDVRDLAAIRNLDALPRLLAVVASQTARLLNVADLSGPFQMTRPTVRDYVTLLSRVFLLDELPPWHSNRLSRLVKTAKLHAGDTGVACALLGLGADELWADRELYGQMLRDVRVRRAPAPGERARTPRPVPPPPGPQGRGGRPGAGAVRAPARRRRGEGCSYRPGQRLPRAPKTPGRRGGAAAGRGRALRRRGDAPVRRRALGGPHPSAVGGPVAGGSNGARLRPEGRDHVHGVHHAFYDGLHARAVAL